MLPKPEDTELICQTTEIKINHGINEAKIGFIDDHHDDDTYNNIKVFLYTTTIKRTILCHQKKEEKKLFEFSYSTVYLNISHHDIDKQIDAVFMKYPINETFHVWYYPDYHYSLRKKNTPLDGNRISMVPIDSNEDFIKIYIITKLYTAFIDICILTFGAFILFVIKEIRLRHIKTWIIDKWYYYSSSGGGSGINNNDNDERHFYI
jgi:hypothetical protein